MGLKFRRGTTAQQSGSLAFGEPYVNTTLGTLVIGGDNGDIILSSTGTGSTGNFGAISGSGLDITGNANIGGNLNINGNFTIGNQTSDNVNIVGSLSSSLIPSTTNAFDLGSETKIWKDLYISTGSIKFVDPGTNTVVGTLSSNAGGDFKVAGEVSGSTINGLGNATLYSSSVNSRLVTVEGVSASAATALNNASSSAYSTFAKLSGDNIFSGTQTITGSLFVSANLVVQGSSSVQNITASAVSIGTNTVILNTDTPSVRFGGISVADSGSGAGASGSLFWDSQNNNWIYQHPIGGDESAMSAVLISGPKNSGSLGSEEKLTLGQVPVAVGDDHIGNSIISASVTKVTIAGDLDTTGNVSASTLSGIGNVTSYSTSVDSRIVTNLNSAAGAFASASAYSASAATVAITNANSAAGAFASASAYSASAAVVAITNANSAAGAFASASAFSASAAVVAITNANSAAGAFASASAYSASAFTAYAKLGAANTFVGNQIVSGSITATGDVVAFSTSDKRHKNNIVLISDALSKVTKLNGVTWEWNDDVDSATKETPKTGLIAQEVQEVLPEVVKERQDGFLALDYSKMMGLMVEAIKEQQQQIHSLTLEIENLKKNNSL